MSNGIVSRIFSKISRKLLQEAADTRLADELNTLLVNYKIKPKEKAIYFSEAEAKLHVNDGYSNSQLNEYIIAKSKIWLENLEISDYRFPPHVYSLLWIIQLAQARLGRPLRILDFGGGAPTIPVMLRKLNAWHLIAQYRIVESPAFVSRIPHEWNDMCNFTDTYDGDACDLLILSTVLPYVGRELSHKVYRNIEQSPPRFIYFGRTSFLRDDYPVEEVYTIQDSRFREHGAQVDVGMSDIENNIAHYVKRHFKWSELAAVLHPLDYKQVLELTDESGLENIKGLGLYCRNSLWELPPHGA